jgi:hypothetical protein
MTLDHLWHLGEVVPLLLVCWRMFRAANRLMDVLKDYPPHLHVNGKLVYPKGFEPGTITRLNVQP